MRRFLSPGFALALLGISVSASPQKVEPPPVLSVRTDLVTLSVGVVDRQGRFVTGLGREDFSVFDGGERTMIEFFTNENVPVTVGLVMDCSGSMRGRREAVAAAAASFASMTRPLDEFFTLNFNDSTWLGLPSTVAFTADSRQLRAALLSAPAEGMSAMYDGVGRALDHLGLGKHDRRALIVVSDGGDNASARDFDSVLERARRSGAVIYAVTLYDPDDHEARPRVLKKLARETGGDAFTPKHVDAVSEAFTQIMRALHSGYTIGFMPSEVPESGFRPIRVEVDAGDGRTLTARTRAGYYAKP